MSEVTVRYEDGLLADLTDPVEAAAYLNAAIEDGDQQMFLLALRDVTEARKISHVARETGLNRENLYRLLSAAGNPQLSSLNALLHSLGLRLAVEVEPGRIPQSSRVEVAVAETPATYHEDAG
ncbi:addiction module antidote protein [Candidatus Amarolinea aalborgensis]|jgi:probable addiction module antidote protein|uniref:addiction module antidote protein n=1 Tax=Candidatus Amarolinea aalborgensis TaxID=2249329 RepID=UPI003BF95DCC